MSASKRPPHQPLTIERARSLRRSLTTAEATLWTCLRGGRLDGLKFRRQCPIGPYIADFCCLERRLIVEIDGGSHDAHEQYDSARSAWLAAHGFRVLRFTNEDIHVAGEGVVQVIAAACSGG